MTNTTIQVDEHVLALLKKLKQEYGVSSYAEAIVITASKNANKVSMAGSLKKYLKKGETVQDILKEMQEERRKSDRF